MYDICTTTSPKTGNFFDLSPLLHHDWTVPGLDYNFNFSISFCGPLSHPADSTTVYSDLETDHEAQNSASASYTDSTTGQTYSLGKSDTHPFFRGRELVLEYHGGSFCREPTTGKLTGLRKSGLVSFKCDHEMTHHVISPTLVGQLSDCAYFFEVKTPHACAVSNQEQSMQPVTIFVFIVVVATIVGLISSQLGKGGKFQLFDGKGGPIGDRVKRVALLLWVVILRIVMAPFRVVKSRRLPL